MLQWKNYTNVTCKHFFKMKICFLGDKSDFSLLIFSFRTISWYILYVTITSKNICLYYYYYYYHYYYYYYEHIRSQQIVENNNIYLYYLCLKLWKVFQCEFIVFRYCKSSLKSPRGGLVFFQTHFKGLFNLAKMLVSVLNQEL